MARKKKKAEPRAGGISTRVRFEIFKRDEFTCGYCGRRSPDVVLEIDHIVAVADGGSDDPINLLTSCFSCNRGKSSVPLGTVMTGEDPYDRAVAILERTRQIEEYNRVAAEDRARRDRDTWDLLIYWNRERGVAKDREEDVLNVDYHWLMSVLRYCPREQIRNFIDIAVQVAATRDLRYVKVCVRNWREQHGIVVDKEA